MINILLPFFFTILGLVTDEEGMVSVQAVTNMPAYNTAVMAADSIGTTSIDIVVVTGENNAERCYVVTSGVDGRPVAVSDAGPVAMSGIVDSLYITDREHNTVTVIFGVDDSSPLLTPSAEGGMTLELTDRITAIVTDQYNASFDEYTLRRGGIVKHIGADGTIRLQSIRPTTDDLGAFVRDYRVYDANGDTLMDASALRSFLRSYFPLP